MVDMERFFELVVFNYIYANGDDHLKNFSVIRQGGDYRLAPAYDLLNTSLHVRGEDFGLDGGLSPDMEKSDVMERTGHHLPNTNSTYSCVNPHFEGVATTDCPLYRSDQKVRYAKGMTHLFTDDMPRRIESAVRHGIIGLTNRTYFFEYRNGKRLIPPALQEDIRDLFRHYGWTGDITFDAYIEDYEW